MISVFDMFKIGIGPSSSHTVGPMKAGKQFVDDLVNKGLMPSITRVAVDVYGSLSLTGKGHHTDIAIILGLAGNMPDTVDIDSIPGFIRDVEQRQRLMLANGLHEVDFPRDGGMVFRSDNLPLHENGMQIHAFAGDKEVYSKTYYSIGGGFIVDEENFGKDAEQELQMPYPFNSAREMLDHCRETGLSLSGMVMQNELALHSKQEIETYFGNVWQTMRACIDRGLNTEGVLPGPLRVPRRASALRRMLVASDKLSNDPMNVIDWVNMFALAVNEENAAGGRVVTAPTNGACGIVPACRTHRPCLNGCGRRSRRWAPPSSNSVRSWPRVLTSWIRPGPTNWIACTAKRRYCHGRHWRRRSLPIWGASPSTCLPSSIARRWRQRRWRKFTAPACTVANRWW